MADRDDYRSDLRETRSIQGHTTAPQMLRRAPARTGKACTGKSLPNPCDGRPRRTCSTHQPCASCAYLDQNDSEARL